MPFSFSHPTPTHLRLPSLFRASVLLIGLLSTPLVHADLLPDLSLRASGNNPTQGPNLGGIVTWQTSPYKNAGAIADFIPNYGYDSELLYLDAARVGLQFKAAGPEIFNTQSAQRFQLFLAHQFEGSPLVGATPPVLASLSPRHSGTDAGAAWLLSGPQDQTTLALQARHDVSQTSYGSTIQLSLQHNSPVGPAVLTPELALSWRSASLNRYYYGISAQEATTALPAYNPGAGLNVSLGLRAQTWLSEHWQVMGGVAATAFSSGLADSPIVQKHGVASLYLGLDYEFEPVGASQHHALTNDNAWFSVLKPDSLKVLTGASTANGCSLVGIVSMQCLNLDHKTFTSMVGFQWGQRLIKDWNNWPVDLFADLGLDLHLEHGQQPDAAQIEVLVKIFYHHFPWDRYVHTRLGLGIGPSDASRPLFAESSANHPGAPRSHLMNYMEPTVDFSLGDILGVDDWRKTYVGFGVSHRSGIFSSSRLLGNVNGGSNFVVVYLERVLN